MPAQEWIGGQAVLEGVMMRRRNLMAIAFRRGDGSVGVYRENLTTAGERFPVLKWPLLRGVVAFFESLWLGMRALNISAAQAIEEEGEELQGWQSALMVVLGLALGIALFFILPTFLARFLPPLHPLILNLAEGLIRLSIFLGYLILITRWKDVQRVFQYHGAEHKVIFCYEDKGELESAAGIRNYSTRHPRCGTSFILTVMVVSILLFSLFGWPSLWHRVLVRLALLPLVAGLSFEAIRYTARSTAWPARLLVTPGLWLQFLTTREPADDQIDVAVCALRGVLEPLEEAGPAIQTASVPSAEVKTGG